LAKIIKNIAKLVIKNINKKHFEHKMNCSINQFLVIKHCSRQKRSLTKYFLNINRQDFNHGIYVYFLKFEQIVKEKVLICLIENESF
jgi:hypothetical protein